MPVLNTVQFAAGPLRYEALSDEQSFANALAVGPRKRFSVSMGESGRQELK